MRTSRFSDLMKQQEVASLGDPKLLDLERHLLCLEQREKSRNLEQQQAKEDLIECLQKYKEDKNDEILNNQDLLDKIYRSTIKTNDTDLFHISNCFKLEYNDLKELKETLKLLKKLGDIVECDTKISLQNKVQDILKNKIYLSLNYKDNKVRIIKICEKLERIKNNPHNNSEEKHKEIYKYLNGLSSYREDEFTTEDSKILANKIFTIPYKSPEIMKFFKAYIDASLIELDYQKAGELMQGFIPDRANLPKTVVVKPWSSYMNHQEGDGKWY